MHDLDFETGAKNQESSIWPEDSGLRLNHYFVCAAKHKYSRGRVVPTTVGMLALRSKIPKALQTDQTPKRTSGEPVSGNREHLEPQQVAVGGSGGCGSIAMGQNPSARRPGPKGLRRPLSSWT